MGIFIVGFWWVCKCYFRKQCWYFNGAVTVFGLVSLYQFNVALSWVRFNFESAAHSLAVLKASGGNVSARADAFISNANGSTDVPTFNLTPDLIGILFLLSVGYLIIGRLWIGHK